ncbi:MAG: SMP-30/gluconolactonase/LRE family protein [candidate division Zixibacteria bacterium]|nr:SMP-30/gluconolactonase/LRE family protein [candidate division Zixibacteria bacterium]
MDGIAMDNDGNIYVTCHTAGTIHRYDPSYTNPPHLISTMHSGPAGLGYNPVDNILAIPNFNGDQVDFISLDDNDGDNVLDFRDNCPNVSNPDQSDIDEDGDGDLCDNCPNDPNPGHEDADLDEIEDACDNCPEHFNPGQEDTNGNDVGDVCDYVCGDIDGNPGINILDIVFLINYTYKSGPDPNPLESADVDSIPPVNILDIVFLINYKYKNGPEPGC